MRVYIPAPDHPEESQRLAALHALDLLDTEPDERFDRITSLAADIFDVETAVVSLVDAQRQWFLSKHGIEACETGRDVAFCAHAIHEAEILVVEDAAAHAVFQSNPLVCGPPHVRFYAGAVLRDPSGLPLGTLCLIDSKPRAFPEAEQDRLIKFGQIVRSEILRADSLFDQDARRDPITGAYWGDAFFTAADRLALSCVGEQFASLVVTITVDNLSFLADTHGGVATDETLVGITERLQSTLERYGAAIAGRLDGKRLSAMTICSRKPDRATLETLRQNLVHQLTKGVDTQAGRLYPRLTISITERSGNRRLRDVIDVCRIAAQYIPAQQGPRSIVVNAAIEGEARRRFRIAADLPGALEHNALSLAFQPKLDVFTEQAAGLECLLRWNHPELGPVAPPDVINTAREAHCVPQLERWVVANACAAARRWLQDRFVFGRMSINISSETLLDPQFFGWFQKTLTDHQLPASRIDLEIVESSLFDDFEGVVTAIKQFKSLGVSFSLDDFGTGYSSLCYLRELPISNLKIDKSFIDDIVEQPDAAAMCSGIISLAHELNMTAVAEGVENKLQHITLRALRCDEVQGYYFARPMDATTAGEYLRALRDNH
ncbi:MAG: sensor domain-containing phosphodiesterase [Pseudomonadota bacterium]